MGEITVLVVDDDKEIADLVEIYLVNDGYRVVKASNGEECLKFLEEDNSIRIIVLDIMMPGIDGLEVCRRIRKESNIPIIMLSAKAEDMDVIVGFGTGVDDYMTKPFHPLELLARVKSQLKRYNILTVPQMTKENPDELVIKDVVLNKAAHTVTKRNREIKLTPIEFEILYMLASNPGHVYNTDEIFEHVWKEKVYEVNNTVMVHIRRLREKLEDDSKNPQILKTVWGVGYKIEI